MQMRSLFLRYGLAIGLSSVVLPVAVLAPQLPREGMYILALAAIVFTAWYGGRGPGWLATLVSFLIIDYFLIHPIGTFWIASWEAAFVLTVFVVVAIMLVEFSETRGRDHLALRASEERWKAVFENTPTMYFMVDQSGIILSVNPFGAEQLGYRVEELVGTSVLDVFYEADREAVQRHVNTCLTHVGRPIMWEFRKVRKDGRIIWVRETAKAVRFAASERVVLVACEDITERKQAEEAAQAANVRLEGILEIAQDAIISVDSNQRIILFNQGAEKVFGYTQAEILGRPLDLLLPQQVEDVHRHIEDFTRTPEVPRTMGQRREVSGRRKDGGEFPAEASISKLDLGSQLVVTVILRDITERKRTDAMLAGEKRVLEMVAKGDSLTQILDSLCRLVEEQAPDILASILLVESNLLRHGGAPSLPKSYIDAIDGVAIGSSVGSCGTAAYRGEQVIVSDIATDPLWADYRAAALSHSLRACWSTPIFSSEGKVNATFAMYYRKPHIPGPHEQEMIGRITHLGGVAIQRALAEEKLRESEARYRILVEHAPEAIVVLDVDAGRFVDANQNAVRLFGLSREALMRVGPIAVSPSSQADGRSSSETILEKIQDAVDGGDPVFQWIHLNAAGEQISCEVHLVRMPATGHVLVRGSITDITERKQAEQRLLVQHTVTQILAEAASLQEATPRILQAICENVIWDMGALWTVDKEAGALRCVEVWHEKSIEVPEFEADTREIAFRRGIGLAGAVWQSQKPTYLSDLSNKESVTFPRAPVAAREEGLHAAFAFPILLSGEVLGVIEFFSREIREPDHDLLDMMITVGSQIGQFIERKRAEDTVRKLQLELAHVVRVSTLGELTATIAHEINQPLGAIVNNAGASLRWLAAQNVEEVRQSIERVIKDGHRASEIISRIRALVKKSAPQKDLLHLDDTIGEIMSLLGPELHAHEVAMHTQLSPDVPAVLGDRIQVQQVLLNLMINAMESMIITKEGPRELRVKAEKHDAQYVVVRVQDSGSGISPQQQDRLFEAFYSTKPGGLGMGLAICRSIVEAHGGRLWATANEDRGAAFHFTLPIGGGAQCSM